MINKRISINLRLLCLSLLKMSLCALKTKNRLHKMCRLIFDLHYPLSKSLWKKKTFKLHWFRFLCKTETMPRRWIWAGRITYHSKYQWGLMKWSLTGRFSEWPLTHCIHFRKIDFDMDEYLKEMRKAVVWHLTHGIFILYNRNLCFNFLSAFNQEQYWFTD